jgi:hypothetical protein
MKILPYSEELLGTLPLGYLARYVLCDTIFALPFIDASGLMSQEGEMYSSF